MPAAPVQSIGKPGGYVNHLSSDKESSKKITQSDGVARGAEGSTVPSETIYQILRPFRHLFIDRLID